MFNIELLVCNSTTAVIPRMINIQAIHSVNSSVVCLTRKI